MQPPDENQRVSSAAVSTREGAGAGETAGAGEMTDLLRGRRVLLVEDNELNRDLAVELLGDLGIEVTVAVNGREALDLVEKQSFDLLLMDIQMPLMDGLTATKMIRADPRFARLPIIAMTAHALPGDRSRSLNAGMNDHLTKPIDPALLERMLARWMPAAFPLPQRLESNPAPQPAAASGDDELPAHLPPFDLPATLARTNNKPALVRKIVIGFLEQYARAASELREYLRSNRIEEAERLVHSLKSIAATLGASELTLAAAALEEALHSRRAAQPAPSPEPASSAGLASLLDTLEDLLAPAVAAAARLERRAPRESGRAAAVSGPGSPTARHSILAVDDEPLILDLLADTFPDYRMLLARDGERALECALRHAPEMILLDVNMPDMDGFELCRRLKAQPRTRDIPVIFLTGLGDAESETRGLMLGAVDYVTKPMNSFALRARIHNQFQLRRAQTELVRMLAKQYLEDMVDELERSAAQDRTRELQLAMRDDFLSQVSHELRSPLAAIHAFVTLVTDQIAGEITPQQDEYLRIALKNVAQLRAMINDLLDTTRLRTGKLHISAEPTPVMDAVQYALRTFAEAARARSICLSSHIEQGISTAYADPTRLRQVLVILLDNAIKFTPAGGSVKVSAHRQEANPESLLIEVADTGCGIDPEQTASIFEQLYQVNNPDLGSRAGLGLGLHIAKELVRRQGGEIWVQSVPGRGSCFYFTVPALRCG